MKEWNLQKDKFTYILRYYLPCEPQYDIDVTESRADELVDFCLQNDVSAAMIYVDLNPYWYYMPDTIEHNCYLVDVVNPLAEKLRANGISYQLNYQNLFGSWDANCDHRDMYNWECYVDEFGRESYGCACMIGDKFREYAGAKLRAWAETKPDAVWIDDDIRFHNHRTGIHDFWNDKTAAEGLDFGCFCDNHIAKFNEKYSTSYTREEIVASIVRKDTDSSLGKFYHEFLDDSLADTARWIEETIHSVSPHTRVALMTSDPDVHTLEVRNWNKLLTNLTGETKVPLMRPTFGPYAEANPRDFAESYRVIRHMDENISGQYKKKYDMCPEIENTRFTVYSKSLAATGYQIDLSAFFGFGGVTLSIFDLEGVKLSEESEFATLLSEHKPLCDTLTSMDIRDYVSTGIAFITSPERYSKISEKSRRISDLRPSRLLDRTISKAGIAYTYITPDKLSAASVIGLDRYSAMLLTDEELRIAMSKSVLMDSGAAEVISNRGYADYLGVVVGDKISCVAASEHIHALTRSDGSKVIVPSRICGNSWIELKLSGAKVLSSLVTPRGDKYPGFTLYDNSIGGTVCIYAAEQDFGDAFFSNYRIKLLKDIIDILDPHSIRVEFPSYATLAVREMDNTSLVFISNLAADPINELKIKLPREPKEILVVNKDGTLLPVDISDGKFVMEEPLNIYNSIVLKITY